MKMKKILFLKANLLLKGFSGYAQTSNFTLANLQPNLIKEVADKLNMKKIILFFLCLPSIAFAQWTQVGKAVNGQAADDRSGYSIAISADGSIVASGSHANDAVANGCGQVRVFKNVNSVWTQIGADLNGETGGDQTGQGVSLSADGSVVAIGEPFNNDLGSTTGQVRVFKNVGGTWTKVGQDLYGDNFSSAAGSTVELSEDGSIMAFGAPGSTVNGNFYAGWAKVFKLVGTAWVQQGADLTSSSLTKNRFGQDVSLSADGNTIAVGHIGNPGAIPSKDTGSVQVFNFINNQWVQLGNTLKGYALNDEFGHDVDLSYSGTILAVGTYQANRVEVFELIGSVWTKVGNTLTGVAASDRFGYSVSLSRNGDKIAVGAPNNSTAGFNKGRIYVYEKIASTWTLINNPIDGDSIDDLAGFGVALSNYGTVVAASSIFNDNANGIDAGHFRVFRNGFPESTNDIIKNTISVFPSPTNDLVGFELNNKIETVTLYNLIGEKVITKVVNSDKFSISLGNLPSGTYFAHLNNGKKVVTTKVVKL